jgi:hypothetical protein
MSIKASIAMEDRMRADVHAAQALALVLNHAASITEEALDKCGYFPGIESACKAAMEGLLESTADVVRDHERGGLEAHQVENIAALQAALPTALAVLFPPHPSEDN